MRLQLRDVDLAHLTCVRLTVRSLNPPCPCQVDHVGGPIVRGREDVATRSIFAISFFSPEETFSRFPIRVLNMRSCAESSVCGERVNSGTSPGNLAERVNSGINPGDFAERVNSGTNPGDLAEKVNLGTSPRDLAERVNSGTNPGDFIERVNSGTNPGDLDDKVNSGISPRDLTKRVNSGTNPGNLVEKVNSGTSPRDLAERVNSGTSPEDLAERVNSGTNPRDLAEKVNSGTSLGALAERVNSDTNPGDLVENVNSGISPGDLAEMVMKADHDLDTIVTEGSLAVIRGRYSIPVEYGLHVSRPGQRPYNSDAHGMCISVDALEAGLRFPLHPLIEECLRWWRISPSQVARNSWRYLVVFQGECRRAGIIPTRDLFMVCFRLCKSRGDYYLTARMDLEDLREMPKMSDSKAPSTHATAPTREVNVSPVREAPKASSKRPIDASTE
ncbi:hypothetical protein B296_00053228 [Ensete ventricosum]|uniref:Transposase (putative) gypsy type domain-containing protein n=1 Tax=Ensete ventricosum TaxID=4639 RepID=A0A426WZZ4_ENSVE|nr:hypothetical protein B296_00053228 [Ensete ventricosum]